ncbi:MAG: glycosyltransferase [Acidimicrobiales bacterium]
MSGGSRRRRLRPRTVSVVVADDGSGSIGASLDALAGCDLGGWELEVLVAPGGGAAARNQLAAKASGACLAFLGAGVEPDPAWLRAALDALERDSTLTCVASRVSAADGTPAWSPSVTFAARPGTAAPASEPPPAALRDVLWASADAMVLRTPAFGEAGGFDPSFEGPLDDLDLGWRLWIAGHRVAEVAASSVRRTPPDAAPDPRRRFLEERNRLSTVFKNVDDAGLAVALPAALALAVHQAAVDGGDPDPSAGGDPAPPSPELAAAARAVDAFVRALPELVEARRRVQAGRRRSDLELRPLLEPLPAPGADHPPAAALVGEALGARARFGTRRRIVVATCDAITARMAGPAIRAWQIAGALAAEHDVQLVTTGAATISDPRFGVRAVDDRQLAELEGWCDVFVFQGWVATGRPFLLSSTKVLVADVYDPLHLEQLEQGRDDGEDARRRAVRNSTEVLNEQLLRGDFFLCANARQRDFWLGQLAALGRVNPETYDEDATLASLISIVPFGIADAPPEHTRPAVKGVVPGIAADDKVILWGGGIYNWFDPLTLLRAVDRLRRRQPAVRLLFMGLRHPNPDIPEMRMASATRGLAEELGLTGTHVFFNEGWVPYDERQNHLLEADVGVSTHMAHLETALSSRTRILDYVWASLPVVATEGDVLSAMVAERGLGITVPPGDVDALEAALFRLLDDEGLAKTCRENAAALAPDLAWSAVLRPLVDFCRRPRRAPDLIRRRPDERAPALVPAQQAAGWRSDVRIGVDHLRDGGPSLLAAKAWARLRRRWG